MILTIGFRSVAKFIDEIHERGLPPLPTNVAIVPSVRDIAKYARTHEHYIIFDTPYRLIRLDNAYAFDYIVLNTQPVTFRKKIPVWNMVRTFRTAKAYLPSMTSGAGADRIIMELIEQQRQNDVIDKINRLKEYFTTTRMDRIVSMFARHIAGQLEYSELERVMVATANNSDDSSKALVQDILKWTVTPAADRLISAMKVAWGRKWRNNYEAIAKSHGVRPFELGFFLVALERSEK